MVEPVQQRVVPFVENGRSLQLVVVIHAYTSDRQRLSNVVHVVREQMPDADILAPEYPAALFSNVNLTEQAIQIVDEITQQYDSPGKSYETIILIGHSLGALLVRMVYLVARGHAPGSEYSRLGLQQLEKRWWDKVERLILFAGMNRGWGLESCPDYMSWPMYYLCRFLLLFEWLLPEDFGRMIRSCRRGAPFVVNLRLQWMKLEREEPMSFPLTIQLLGESDSIVQKTDSIDLESGFNFIYKKMPKAGHLNIIRFTPRQPRGWFKRLCQFLFGPWRDDEGVDDPKRRKEIFIDALTKQKGEGKENIISDLYPEKLNINIKVKHAVLIMHGIRDRGGWTALIAAELKKLGKERDQEIEIEQSSYGYFSMLRFLLMVRRQENVRKLADWYTKLVALNPNAQISFIGHSNGTYLAASALDRYDLVSFDSILFAGSVVAQDYKWSEKFEHGRVNSLRNMMADSDWIVAWLPRIFEMFATPKPLHPVEIGSGGFNGFNDGEAKENEIAYLRGGHDAGIKKELYQSIAYFIIDRSLATIPENLKTDKKSRWIDFFSKFAWIVWLGLTVLVVLIGFLVVKLLLLASFSTFYSVLFYIIFLLVILLSV